jgi:hypothetical protein
LSLAKIRVQASAHWAAPNERMATAVRMAVAEPVLVIN